MNHLMEIKQMCDLIFFHFSLWMYYGVMILSNERKKKEQKEHFYLKLTSTGYNMSLENNFQPMCFCHVNSF